MESIPEEPSASATSITLAPTTVTTPATPSATAPATTATATTNTTKPNQKKHPPHKTARTKVTDCCCSALIINCCQFPCFIPHRGVICPIDADSNADTANWMFQLQQYHPGVQLRDLVFMGTHDAASSTISFSQFFSAVGRTQQLTVYDQLMAGARYLDLRVAGSKRTKNTTAVVIQHGCLPGGSFQEVIDDIKIFLHEHIGELLILDIVPEFGQNFANDDKHECLTLLQNAFQDMLLPVDDLPLALTSSKTLKQIVKEEQRRVIILLHERFFEQDPADDEAAAGAAAGDSSGLDQASIRTQFGFGNAKQFIHNTWHNTRDVPHLLQSNLKDVRHNGTDRTKFCASQFVLTPGAAQAKEIVQAVLGLNPLRPVSWALRLYQQNHFDNFLRHSASEPWNILVVDYMDLCPTAVDFIIALNFAATLTIEAAVVTATTINPENKQEQHHSVNVTDKMQSYICRNRVLWLTNVNQDLDLKPEIKQGNLTIAYRLDVMPPQEEQPDNYYNNPEVGANQPPASGTASISTFHILYLEHWNSTTPVLLSQFATNSHGTIQTTLRRTVEKQYVQKGNVVDSGDDSCVLSFQWEGRQKCKFTIHEN